MSASGRLTSTPSDHRGSRCPLRGWRWHPHIGQVGPGRRSPRRAAGEQVRPEQGPQPSWVRLFRGAPVGEHDGGATSCWVTANNSVRRGTTKPDLMSAEQPALRTRTGRPRPPTSLRPAQRNPNRRLNFRRSQSLEPSRSPRQNVLWWSQDSKTATESSPSPHSVDRFLNALSISHDLEPTSSPSSTSVSLINHTHVRSGAGADAGRAVDVGEADAGLARHLAFAGVAPQLEHDLVDLAQPRRTDRLAVGEAAAVGVDREPAADLGGPARIRSSCSPCSQNPVSAMCMISAPLSVSCSWATSMSRGGHAGGSEDGGRGRSGDAGGAPGSEPASKHLEGAELAGCDDRSRDHQRATGRATCDARQNDDGRALDRASRACTGSVARSPSVRP